MISRWILDSRPWFVKYGREQSVDWITQPVSVHPAYYLLPFVWICPKDAIVGFSTLVLCSDWTHTDTDATCRPAQWIMYSIYGRKYKETNCKWSRNSVVWVLIRLWSFISHWSSIPTTQTEAAGTRTSVLHKLAQPLAIWFWVCASHWLTMA